jgi:hypothetical protein
LTGTYAPQPGDIGLTSIHGWAGFGIRVGQGILGDGWSRYEHAFVLVNDSQIVEAEPGGALLSELDRYDPASVMWLRCPPQFGASVAAAARTKVGTPYSWLDYLSLGAEHFHLPVPGLRRYVANSHHEMCSQLADTAAFMGGWHLFADGRDPGDVTPGDFWKLAEQQVAPPVAA